MVENVTMVTCMYTYYTYIYYYSSVLLSTELLINIDIKYNTILLKNKAF